MTNKQQAPKIKKVSRTDPNKEKSYGTRVIEYLMNNRKIKNEGWQRKFDNYGFVKIYWDKESNEKQ